jgi:serine/threonine-protein kinase
MSFDNLSGQFLGQYELRDALGQGDMGAVYRAVQANLKRDVAIKILPTHWHCSLATSGISPAKRNCSAPTSVVPIIDYGMQRGISYVVMRLLTGGSLAQRINQRTVMGSLTFLSEAAHMLTQLASALITPIRRE